METKIHHVSHLSNNCRYNHMLGRKQMNFVQTSPVDEFYIESISNPRNAKSVVQCYTNPIRMLFNQERLSKVGEFGVMKWLEQFKGSSSALDELRKKCSDADLVSMIRSRHIQAPADVLAWARHMQSNMDSFNEELKQLYEVQQTEHNENNVESKSD